LTPFSPLELGAFDTDKKSSFGQSGELCLSLPKRPIAGQKINVDNKAHFRYLDSYWFRLIDASICGPKPIHNSAFSILPLRKSNFLSFPVRHCRTPGSVGGRLGNWPFYLDSL